MRFYHLPQCPRCDSGKIPRVVVDFSNADCTDERFCGSCSTKLTGITPFSIDDERTIQAVKGLISKKHGDGGETVGEFEIVEWAYFRTDPCQPDYYVVLQARDAPGYTVEIQAIKKKNSVVTFRPVYPDDEHKVLRRATMPHVLVQAIDAMNGLGFRGCQRSHDRHENWVYLDLPPQESDRLYWRIKMSWPQPRIRSL
ncbi:MAG: hypothetical protein EKK48_23980 [Candidatus Melainabacteria bacterium]|nr:MAG: hypothetical protein EKK48_23980 [Candidatus Melainabacteria bacterium]